MISGVVVCWHFELLPRWALALLAARELFMLVLVRYALRHGVDLKVNWLGRAGVWPVLARCSSRWPAWTGSARACLYVGLALVLGSTRQYVRDGLRQTRLQARPSSLTTCYARRARPD